MACPEFTLTRAFSARARARFSWRFSLISRSTISARLVTRASPLSLGRRPPFGAGRSEAPWVLRGRPARRRGAADAISVAAVVVISSVVMTPLLARSDSFTRTRSGIKYGSTPPQYGLSMAASTYRLNCEPTGARVQRRTSCHMRRWTHARRRQELRSLLRGRPVRPPSLWRARTAKPHDLASVINIVDVN